VHRIDAEGNVAGLFTEGDPGQAIPATVVSAAWSNDLQEEICNLLEAMGITLVKGNRTQLRDACVSAATALKLMRRDAAGRAKVADPSAADDIDTKGARDTAITSGVSTHNAVTNPHSATSAATASRLVLRDAAGRAQFADPSADADAATKGFVAAQIAPVNDSIGTTFYVTGATGAQVAKAGTIVNSQWSRVSAGRWRMSLLSGSDYLLATVLAAQADVWMRSAPAAGSVDIYATDPATGLPVDANFTVRIVKAAAL
jgi:hypothetical protein